MVETTGPADADRPRTAADATTARIAVAADGFALGTLFERVPDARVECEPTVGAPADRVLFAIRTDTTAHDEVVTALRVDPSVASIDRLADRDDGWMFRAAWGEQPRRFVECVRGKDATIQSARGRDGTWTLRLLLPDRETLARAYEAMVDGECGVELERIGTYDGGHRDQINLTDEQREALITAFEAGYYEVPREATATDLADDLDISHQALSERFRRAYGRIVESTVVDGRATDHE